VSLRQSFQYCERLARREAGNFYHAFRVLPNAQRQAMCALYSFLRVADDLSDSPQAAVEKRLQLADWRQQLDAALQGRYSHPLHGALHHTVSRFQIPRGYLDAALDGVAMDLERVRYETFDDLRSYCYHVASVVGLACIHVWGFTEERAKRHAADVGIAFQLTNILRDLGEDAARGRVYLPGEDLRRFDYSVAELERGERNDQFRALMRFQVERARQYYDAAAQLVPLLQPVGRAVFLVLARTYQSLLDAIERRDYDVFSSRVRISSWRKLCHALGALPVRWGWA